MARILVVDDEKGMRESLRAFLLHAQHEVFLAENSEQAIRILAQHAVDLVITDIVMPRISGVALLNTIHKNYPEIQTIVITGEPCLETATQALRAGAYDYLAKPVQGSKLCLLIDKALAEGRSLREMHTHCRSLETQLAERSQQLKELGEKIRLVSKTALEWMAEESETEIARRMLALLSQLVGAQGGSVFLRKSEHLRLVEALDPGHQHREIPLPPPPSSVLGTLFQTRKAFLVEDVKTQSQTTSSGFNGYRNGSFLAIPLQGNDHQLVGALTLHDKAAPPFTQYDLHLGEILALHGSEILRTAKKDD